MCSMAYVTLVMKDDKYIAGALVLAQSLQNSGTKCSLICMVTNDITTKSIKVLSRFFDHVWTVPYIRHKCIDFKNRRQRVLYGNWIEESFTKWNCLNPKIFGSFDKVLFIDADMIAVDNCDDQIFSLEPPAMTFSLPWAKPYSPHGIDNLYGELPHGFQLSAQEIIDKGFDTFVGIGSLVLLRPDQRVFQHMLRLLNQNPVFGWSKCFSGFDEQLICNTYCSLNQSFSHIHQCYNWSAGKSEWLSIAKIIEPNIKPQMIHYYGDKKPWFSSRNGQWDDTNLWWDIADQVIRKHDSTRKYFELRY